MNPKTPAHASLHLLLAAWLVNVAALVAEIGAAALFLSALSAELAYSDEHVSYGPAAAVALVALALVIGGVILTATTVVRHRTTRPVAVLILAVFTVLPALPLLYLLRLVFRAVLGL